MHIKNKSLLSLTLASVMLLSACDQVKSHLPNQDKTKKIQCDSSQSKQQVQQVIVEKISDMSKMEIKRAINDGMDIDISQLHAMVKALNVSVQDVRTEQSDEKSQKHQCASTLSIQIPSSMVEEADQARKINEEKSVQKQALINDLKFDNNKLTADINYKIQVTDDGKKTHVAVDNAHILSRFVANIIVDALLKPTVEQQKRLSDEAIEEENRIFEEMEKEEEKKQAEQDKVKAEYRAVLEKEAKQKLDDANASLNLVWNDAEAEVKESLLPAQKIWLEKRKTECNVKAMETEDENERPLVRLKCEESMTKQRVPELKSEINRLRSALSQE